MSRTSRIARAAIGPRMPAVAESSAPVARLDREQWLKMPAPAAVPRLSDACLCPNFDVSWVPIVACCGVCY